MSSRSQHDTVIDDDDEVCPLCIEEFDLSDKNFKPCPCGYQICQFCYNNIKTHSEEGRCPNCRREYDESTIQYRVPDVDEFKADLALKHRKAAAAKKKEAEKREIEASSRKNLAGVRVVQKNLVYVIGLNPTIRDENQLLQTLRGDQYFGQYGDIEKIVVSKAKPGGNPNQGIGVYVTFARKADAEACIAAVDGSPNGDRMLRAQYGTTKYCSSFLRNEQCNNRNCTFLHETGDDSDSFSRQDLSSLNTLSSQRFQSGAQPASLNSNQPSHPHPHSRPPHHPSSNHAGQANAAARQPNTKDESANRASDGSALPSSASWANKDSHVQRARRASMTASRSTPSPKPGNASVAGKAEDSKTDKRSQQNQFSSSQPPPPSSSASQSPPASNPQEQSQTDIVLENLVKAISSPDFRFVFSTSSFPADAIALPDDYPSMIDPYGGVKRRAMREKAEKERAKQEAEGKALLQSNQLEEENPESGSSQLGGEPEESHAGSSSGRRTEREPQSVIQPPAQQATATNSLAESPLSTIQQFQGLNLNGRTMTPQQQHQLMLKGINGQQTGLMDQLPTATSTPGYEQNPLQRAGTLPTQTAPMGANHGHARQSSRFSFAHDSSAKTPNNQRMASQQPPMMPASNPNPLATPTGQHGLGGQYFASGVQGPPPGLKSAGTPPVSGGGMFAQGHGFTSGMNTNMGLGAKQDGNADMMRELIRGRSATGGAGGVQAHEAPKREFMSPFLQQHNTPSSLAPVSGLLSSLYGHQTGPYQEPGPQKQKKRGKKHRHANTSSGGGGVVDLADPSILQARMHQGGANAAAAAGQGLYGSQGQATDEDFPPLAPPKHNEAFLPHSRFLNESPVSRGSGTPTLPPGLPLPHAHPAAELSRQSTTASPTLPITGRSTIRAPPGLSNAGNIGDRKTMGPSETPVAGSPAISSQEKSAAEVSFGSPKPKSTTTKKITSGRPSPTVEQNDKTIDEATEAPAAKATKASLDTSAKQGPLKLDTSTNNRSRDTSPSKTSTPVHTAATTAGSQPDTPGPANAQASESPLPRQPRVLRVVDTSKSETPPAPAAPAPSDNSTAASKPRARRTSLSSTSRPATPAEVGSEYTSASVSRANSPAPNRVGSAPVRTVSKNQQKKERKLKAKQAEVKKEEVSAPPISEEPVQAPIIGRKRKTKKPSAKRPTEQTQTSTNNNSDVEEDEVKVPVTSGKNNNKKDATLPQDEAKKDEESEPWRKNNTVSQLVADAEETGRSIKDLFLERTSPLPVVLGQLHQSGELDLNTHPLFNPPTPNQRLDMKCTAEDYDTIKKPIELTAEHRKQLLSGEPVRVQASSDLLKNRCLITPSGCVLRHLSEEEEERYLLLEKKLITSDSLMEYPALTIGDPDTTNRGGGLDALFATPEKFNIRWVDEPPQSSLMTGASEGAPIVRLPSPAASRSPSPPPPPPPQGEEAPTVKFGSPSDWAEAKATATVRMPVGALVPYSSISNQLEELINMPTDELEVLIAEAHRNLERSKKETDVVDKTIMGLAKRNRKVVNQALAAAWKSVIDAQEK